MSAVSKPTNHSGDINGPPRESAGASQPRLLQDRRFVSIWIN